MPPPSSWPYSVYTHIHEDTYVCIFVCADRRIGMKAEEAGAVLLTLNLLKHNVKHAKRAAACLWVIQVFSSSGTNTHTDVYWHGLNISSFPGFSINYLFAIILVIFRYPR